MSRNIGSDLESDPDTDGAFQAAWSGFITKAGASLLSGMCAGGIAQRFPETREADIGAFRLMDARLPIRNQAGDGKRHRHAMVTVGIYVRASQALASWNPHTVRFLFDFSPHGPQIGSQNRNPVALFDTQFTGIRDFQAACDLRTKDCQHGNLIDEGRNQASLYRLHPAAQKVHPIPDPQVSSGFAQLFRLVFDG
jgi:hypothetical protein